ncbi:MAG: aminoacyl-tRNA hydrolase [Candidatus Campbellbacteria bacterium]|nr:aminoacyl-tRNA hydrolase [Candidatus Campbellbacteria bacterium]
MLIFGLGNPGRKYASTRHNIGRDLLLDISEENNFNNWEFDKYANAYLTEAKVDDDHVSRFALPETFMNRSGEAVRELVKRFDVSSGEVVVMYDDIDLPVGSVRISKDRGDGGHKGLRSIVDHLHTRDFIRIRLGVCPVDEGGEKNKPPKEIVRDYVLGRFSPEEREKVEKLPSLVWKVIRSLEIYGLTETMNRFN